MSTAAAYKILRPKSSDIDGEGLPFIEDKEEESIPYHQRMQQRIAFPGPWTALPWLLVVLCIGYIFVRSVQRPSELECTRMLNPYCKSPTFFTHGHVRTNIHKPR
jgi:hypothetical protein